MGRHGTYPYADRANFQELAPGIGRPEIEIRGVEKRLSQKSLPSSLFQREESFWKRGMEGGFMEFQKTGLLPAC